jgi:hypothetical protein
MEIIMVDVIHVYVVMDMWVRENDDDVGELDGGDS